MASLPIFTIDSFTSKPFAGNPAAVVLLESDLPTSLYQKIAAELNLSETAFVKSLSGKSFESEESFSLRWFTPTAEVPFCGHATLAAAHVIFNEYANTNEILKFETMFRGCLYCERASDGRIKMNFPQYTDITKVEISAPSNPLKSVEKLNELVKITVGHVPTSAIHFSQKEKTFIIILDDNCTRDQLESLRPDVDSLLHIDNGDIIRVLSVTLRGSLTNGCVDSDGVLYDFVSRCFAPWVGIKEDPATGSLHCGLGPVWQQYLDKSQFYSLQCYPGRGAQFRLKLVKDDRIDIIGDAVTIIKVFTVDSFTKSQFTGNPAGVVILENDIPVSLCQKIATELNLPMTAFVKPQDNRSFKYGAEKHFLLRWFNPTTEGTFCGHATVAAAHVLFNEFDNIHPMIHFENFFAGKFSCSRMPEHQIKLDFPLFDDITRVDTSTGKLDIPDELRYCNIETLIENVIGDMSTSAIYFTEKGKILLLVLDDTCTREQLESLYPNGNSLLKIHNGDVIRGVGVTLRGSWLNGCMDPNGRQYDFVSRYFAPWMGVPEDPATGSLHCILGPVWAEQLDKSELYSFQCYPGRGAEFRLKVGNEGRIDIIGDAVTVIKGTLSCNFFG